MDIGGRRVPHDLDSGSNVNGAGECLGALVAGSDGQRARADARTDFCGRDHRCFGQCLAAGQMFKADARLPRDLPHDRRAARLGRPRGLQPGD